MLPVILGLVPAMPFIASHIVAGTIVGAVLAPAEPSEREPTPVAEVINQTQAP